MAEQEGIRADVTARLATARESVSDNARRLGVLRSRLTAIQEQFDRGRSRREVLHDSAYARLQAQLETMPVIEQAKGILMAEQRCGPDEAFDLLRRASQRANVKLHVLAAQIVDQAASGKPAAGPAPSRSNRSGAA